MLSFLVSIPIIAAAVFFTVRTARRMWRLNAGWVWWSALCLVVCTGGYVGYRLGYYEIQTSPTFRWAGLPLPIGFFVLEGEHWTDFIPPPPIQWTNFLADILTPVLILVIPFFVIWRRRGKMKGDDDGANQCGANRRPAGRSVGSAFAKATADRSDNLSAKLAADRGLRCQRRHDMVAPS